MELLKGHRSPVLAGLLLILFENLEFLIWRQLRRLDKGGSEQTSLLSVNA